MSIPDYMISRTIADEHKHRQVHTDPAPDLPEPQRRRRGANAPFAFLRRQMGAALRAAAERIEPQPMFEGR